jgi:uncharacterized protein YbbC (DUF1343 family)
METKLTSVKIIKDLYSNFKKLTLDSSEKFTLQQLVNRSINLYINDESFRKTLSEHTQLQIVSGSQF